MITRSLLAAAGFLASGLFTPAAMAQFGTSPQYDQLGAARARGEDPTYHVNRYGCGNYVQGPNGADGGYPAGSDGAIELQNEHDINCRYARKLLRPEGPDGNPRQPIGSTKRDLSPAGPARPA